VLGENCLIGVCDLNWQIKTRSWGRTVPHSEWRIRNNHINRIYYIHSGQVYVETNGKCVRLLPGHLYLLPEELPFEAWTRVDDPMDHTFFDFDAIPCLLQQEIVDIPVEAHPVIQKWLEFMQELYRTYRAKWWEREILEIVSIFRARVVDVDPGCLVVEATGQASKLEALIKMLEPFTILEMVRTGLAAVERGSKQFKF